MKTNFVFKIALFISLAINGVSIYAQPLRGSYSSSWIGTTYGGRNDGLGGKWFDASDPLDDWVQNNIDCMTVDADGTCYTNSEWDEAGRTRGIYKDGDVLGNATAFTGNCGMAGGFTIIGTTISGNGKTITDAGIPTAIAMGDGDLEGKLLVADNGARKQILVYDVSGTPNIVETIGAVGGIAASLTIGYNFPESTNAPAYAAGTYAPGFYHPLKLWGLTGVGCDNQGRVFVSHSEQGSGIRCFKKISGNWILDWRTECYMFVDNVFYDEKTDAVDLYGIQEHYKMNYNTTVPGGEWSIYGYSLDKDNYPEDPRGVGEVKSGAEHRLTGTIMREINGIRYIWSSGMTCQPPVIFKYKPGTEIAVPCGFFWGRQDRIYNLDHSFWWPPQKPTWAPNTTSFWEDLNDNGKFEANEYTDQSHEFRASDFMVDKLGNIWQGENPIRVWNASFMPNGNIHYSSNNITNYNITGIPNIGKIVYQEDKDRLVLLTEACRNITGGKVYVVDNWSTGNRAARYISTLWGPNQSSWSAAGDYAFEVGWETRAQVWVTDLRDGSLVGTIEPSEACGGVGRTGWVDIAMGLQAYQRTQGEYLIFVEDDGMGRVILYRWCESGTCGGMSIAANSVTLNHTKVSVALYGQIQLTPTVLPTNCTDKTITWSTSNSAIATVDEQGIVTGFALGTVTITATTVGGTKTATSIVTVTPGGDDSATHIFRLEPNGDGFNLVTRFEYYNGSTLVGVSYNNALIGGNFQPNGGGFTGSNTVGDYLEISFTGSKFELFGNKTPYGGTGKVYIDGVYQQNVNFYDDLVLEYSALLYLGGLKSNPEGVLPITLTSFTGSLTTNGNLIAWKTGSEKNNNHFDLERSGDNKTFEKIATLKGSGTSNSMKIYSHLDKASPFKTSYYRLKQIDIDGKFTYSAVIAVKSNFTEKFLVYPNAFKDELNITLSDGLWHDAKVHVYDMFGHDIALQFTVKGSTINLKTNDLPVGSYVLKVITGQVVYNKIIIKN